MSRPVTPDPISTPKLVMWSGGCDSTLALHDALVESRAGYWNGSSAWGTVRAATVIVDGIDERQRQCEAEARERAIAWFNEKKLGFRHDVVEIGKAPFEHVTGGTIQGQIWVGLASLMARQHEDVVVSYLYGESEADSTVAPFEGMQKLGNKDGRLLVPLRMVRKARVIKRLKDLGLYGATWYCEQYARQGVRKADIRKRGALLTEKVLADVREQRERQAH